VLERRGVRRGSGLGLLERRSDLRGRARPHGVDVRLRHAVGKKPHGQSFDRGAEARAQVGRDVARVVVCSMAVAAERNGLQRLRPTAGACPLDCSQGMLQPPRMRSATFVFTICRPVGVE